MYNSFVLSSRMFLRPFFHATKSMSTHTSALAKLRRSTGYPMAKCKKALELHDSDLKQAELWLHAEAQKSGWSKIANLEGRSATQGLIGVFAQNSIAAMIEVNCETDFVARNAEFQALCSSALSTCVNHTIKLNCQEDFVKLSLGPEDLNNLKYENTSLADIVATAIGRFGETTILKRAVCIKTKENISMSSFVHPTLSFPDFPGASMGRFGALLLYKKVEDSIPHPVDEMNTTESEFGIQLCQHIVGMNPNLIGDFTEADITALQKQHQDNSSEQEAEKLNENIAIENVVADKDDAVEDKDIVDEGEKEAMEEIHRQKKVNENENRLVHQAFMLEPNYVVGEKLQALSVKVLHFERFECGENISLV